jgi:hypothetical protein
MFFILTRKNHLKNQVNIIHNIKYNAKTNTHQTVQISPSFAQ